VPSALKGEQWSQDSLANEGGTDLSKIKDVTSLDRLGMLNELRITNSQVVVPHKNEQIKGHG
jgi:hypothetical protein